MAINNKAEELVKKIGDTHVNAKIEMLKDLIEEVKEFNYTSVGEVVGSMNNTLDILIKIKAKRDSNDK